MSHFNVSPGVTDEGWTWQLHPAAYCLIRRNMYTNYYKPGSALISASYANLLIQNGFEVFALPDSTHENTIVYTENAPVPIIRPLNPAIPQTGSQKAQMCWIDGLTPPRASQNYKETGMSGVMSSHQMDWTQMPPGFAPPPGFLRHPPPPGFHTIPTQHKIDPNQRYFTPAPAWNCHLEEDGVTGFVGSNMPNTMDFHSESAEYHVRSETEVDIAISHNERVDMDDFTRQGGFASPRRARSYHNANQTSLVPQASDEKMIIPSADIRRPNDSPSNFQTASPLLSVTPVDALKSDSDVAAGLTKPSSHTTMKSTTFTPAPPLVASSCGMQADESSSEEEDSHIDRTQSSMSSDESDLVASIMESDELNTAIELSSPDVVTAIEVLSEEKWATKADFGAKNLKNKSRTVRDKKTKASKQDTEDDIIKQTQLENEMIDFPAQLMNYACFVEYHRAKHFAGRQFGYGELFGIQRVIANYYQNTCVFAQLASFRQDSRLDDFLDYKLKEAKHALDERMQTFWSELRQKSSIFDFVLEDAIWLYSLKDTPILERMSKELYAFILHFDRNSLKTVELLEERDIKDYAKSIDVTYLCDYINRAVSVRTERVYRDDIRNVTKSKLELQFNTNYCTLKYDELWSRDNATKTLEKWAATFKNRNNRLAQRLLRILILLKSEIIDFDVYQLEILTRSMTKNQMINVYLHYLTNVFGMDLGRLESLPDMPLPTVTTPSEATRSKDSTSGAGPSTSNPCSNSQAVSDFPAETPSFSGKK